MTELKQLYFDELLVKSKGFAEESYRAACAKEMIAATRKIFEDQKLRAQFALALFEQVPAELIPLLDFPTPTTCFITGTKIELVYTGPATSPKLQQYRLHLPTWEHYDDYRMALARHAEHQEGRL